MNHTAVRLSLLIVLSVLVCDICLRGQAPAKAPVPEPKIQNGPPAARPPGFNSIDATATLDFFNGRPVPRDAYRVLFIGDSLTLHERVPNLWDVWSGMAAAEPAQDFVHLTASHIQSELGAVPVEIFYDNGGNGRLPNMLAYLKRHPEFKPSLIVLQGGENDPFDANFETTYRALLDYFSVPKVPMIVLGDFWDAEKEDFEQKESLDRGLLFIDINVIQKNPIMSGDGGPYNVAGVARHPNTKGMQAIADAIDSRFDKSVLPSLKAAK